MLVAILINSQKCCLTFYLWKHHTAHWTIVKDHQFLLLLIHLLNKKLVQFSHPMGQRLNLKSLDLQFFWRQYAKHHETMAQIYDMTQLIAPNLIFLSMLTTLFTSYFPIVQLLPMERKCQTQTEFTLIKFPLKRNIPMEWRYLAKLSRIYLRSRTCTPCQYRLYNQSSRD